jgi:hypothetical protein
VPAVARMCQLDAESLNIIHGTTTRKEKSSPKLAVLSYFREILFAVPVRSLLFPFSW